MRRASQARVAALLLAAGSGAAAPIPWHVPGAPYRLVLEPGPGQTAQAEAGQAAVPPLAAPPPAVGLRLFTPAGAPVGVRVLWAAEGEPVRIMFDTSSHAPAYYLYPAGAAADAPAWDPRAGVVLETRARAEFPLSTVAEIRRLWEHSRSILGRSVVPCVNSATHVHGPSTNFAARYTGWFIATQAGDYRFATVSDDGSFLEIDSRQVAAWPGLHTAAPGRRGDHDGHVRLAAGRHRLDYWHVQVSDEAVALAAWQPPGRTRLEPMPASAFVPVAGYAARHFECAPGDRSSRTCFEWETVEHNAVDDLALVTLEFRVLADEQRSLCAWTFDDGSSATGAVVRHTFPRPRLRAVSLRTTRPDGSTGAAQSPVLAHPAWGQASEWDDGRFARQKRELAERDLTRMPIADLLYLIALAERVQERGWLARLGPAALDRPDELKPAHADVIYRLAFDLQHPSVREHDLARRAFERVAALADDPALQARARLHKAGLLIHGSANASDGAALLDSIDESRLTDGERRLRRLYAGDALLCQGRPGEARAAYAEAGDIVDRSNVRYAVTRRARMQSARDYLRSGELDEAARMVGEIEWETPLERLAPETGRILVDVYRRRGELGFALTRCTALLQLDLLERDRADLLFTRVEICNAMGDAKGAQESLARLLRDHPYSEAAARAVDRWGRPAGAAPGQGEAAR